MTSNRMVDGRRVRQARMLRGISAGFVARHCGWSNARQSRIENSFELHLPAEDRSDLAWTLDVPQAYLCTGLVPAPNASDILLYLPPSRPRKQVEHLAAVAGAVGDVLDALHSRMPRESTFPVRQTATPSPGSAAHWMRTTLGISRGTPVIDLIGALETHGVVVVPRSPIATHRRHPTYATRVGHRHWPLIVCGTFTTTTSTMWDLSRALGHLVHTATATDIDPHESWAHTFAAEFLVPDEVLGKIAQSYRSGVPFGALAHHWGVPEQRLADRLVDHDHLTARQSLCLRRNLHAAHQRPTPRLRRPSILHRWALQACGRLDDTTRLAALLPLTPEDVIAELLSGRTGDRARRRAA